MAWLKGSEIGGYVNITKNVKFTGNVLAHSINLNPFGDVYYVDGVNGDDDFDGLSPTKAKVTIDAAAQLMTVGDVCLINPKAYVVGTGHARYEECATIDLAQSDLTFIGIGTPKSSEFGVRMKCDGTSLYCFDVSAPSCHFENIGLFSSSGTYTLYARNDGVTATQRGSDGITLYNVNSKGSPLYIQGGQAARVIDSVFNNAATELVLSDGTVTGYNQQVRGCAFLDTAQATACTHPHITGGGVAELWVDHCFFGRLPTSTAYYISLTGSNSSGMATNCFFNTTNLDTDTEIDIDSSAFALVGCYDTTGLIDATND